jgi:PDZ domain-containing protein
VTVDELAIREPAEEPPAPRRWSPRARWAAALAAVVVVGLVTAGLLVKLPYYTLSPGSSRATEPLISVSGTQTYDNEGNVDFLTVSLRQTTPVEALAAWINPAVDVVPEEDILGTQTPEQNRRVNLQMMSDSKDAATYQALHRLGYDIPMSGSGAVVASVQDGSPASGVLEPGDVVVAVDGQAVALNSDLVAIIGAEAPGAVLQMDVTSLEEGAATRSVEVTLGARPDDLTKGFLGVSTFTRDLSFDFPVDVTIDSGSVGGPSAGLAFTLGLLDVLTPDSITGGLKIATTGTMSLDGTVGPVGGVHQKVVAAKRDGVQLMLVPSTEVDEARRYADGLRIEAVDSLDQALQVLTTVGGGDDVLPPEPAPAAVG